MKNSYLVAAAICVASITPAAAADAITGIPATEYVAPAVDYYWSGFYAGIFGGSWGGNVGNAQGVLGATVGYSAELGDSGFVASGELYALTFLNDAFRSNEFFVNARFGYLLTDQFQVFALGGLGKFSAPGRDVALYQAGLGAEFLVTEQLAIRGEVNYLAPTNTNLFNGPVVAKAGLAWHF